MTKFLYLISQEERVGYDTFDSAVVCAASSEQARSIHPHDGMFPDMDNWRSAGDLWASSSDNVAVQVIGLADDSVECPSVVLASFNAG